MLLAFYDFPAEHWVHLRTSNPIESMFATVRHRTRVAKGPGSRAAGLAMAFKLIESAQDRWRAVNALRLVAEMPASGPGRRAFVDITPSTGPADTDAQAQGWRRPDHARTFRLRHWDYDAELVDGFDYDIGAVLISERPPKGNLN